MLVCTTGDAGAGIECSNIAGSFRIGGEDGAWMGTWGAFLTISDGQITIHECT